MPNNKLNKYQQWITNWLTARKDIFDQNYNEAHPYRSLIPYASQYELNKQLNNVKNTKAYIGKTGFDAIKKIIGNQKLGIYQFDNFSEYDSGSFGGKNGQAFRINGKPIIYLTDKGAVRAGIHEYTHQLVPGSVDDNYVKSPQDIKIAKILSEDPYFKNKKQQIFGKYRTLDSKGKLVYVFTPDEVYARLMQLRHDFNMDPNHIWTEDEVSKERKNWGEKDGTHYYFDKGISNKTLTKLLNEVAYDNSNFTNDQTDNIYENNQSFYARKGTKLLKRNR